MKPKDIKTLVLKMQPPIGVSGRMNVEEWMIERAAELGYELALSQIGIGLKKAYWK